MHTWLSWNCPASAIEAQAARGHPGLAAVHRKVDGKHVAGGMPIHSKMCLYDRFSWEQLLANKCPKRYGACTGIIKGRLKPAAGLSRLALKFGLRPRNDRATLCDGLLAVNHLR